MKHHHAKNLLFWRRPYKRLPSQVLFLVLVIIPALLFLFGSEDQIRALSHGEDSFIEVCSALLYLFGALFLLLKMKAPQNTSFGGGGNARPAADRTFLGIHIILFGEETSWLQHILNYDTPSWIKSTQGEFNLHNLSTFHSREIMHYLNEGFDLTFFGANNLFVIFFLSFFILLPGLTSVYSMLMRKREDVLPTVNNRLRFLKNPSWQLWAFSFSVSFLATILVYEEPYLKRGVAELRELMFALVIFQYSVLERSNA